MEYAEEKGIPFIDGRTIVEHYRKFREVEVSLFV